MEFKRNFSWGRDDIPKQLLLSSLQENSISNRFLYAALIVLELTM